MEEINYKTEQSNPTEQRKRMDSYRQALEKLNEEKQSEKQG